MTREEIADKLSGYLRQSLIDDVSEVDRNADLRTVLGLDSMGAIEFVTMLEDELGIAISDEELRGILTLNDAIDLAEKRLAK